MWGLVRYLGNKTPDFVGARNGDTGTGGMRVVIA